MKPTITRQRVRAKLAGRSLAIRRCERPVIATPNGSLLISLKPAPETALSLWMPPIAYLGSFSFLT
jgi:hypothetical protein